MQIMILIFFETGVNIFVNSLCKVLDYQTLYFAKTIHLYLPEYTIPVLFTAIQI